MKDINKLLKQRQEEFITSRVEIEAWVTRLFKQIEDVDLSSIEDKPQGTTAKELFPSLYSEEFSVEAYEKELSIFTKWYSKVERYAEAVNAKAIELLTKAAV